MLRMSHAIVSARYSAKIQVRCVAVWITFPLYQVDRFVRVVETLAKDIDEAVFHPVQSP